MRTLGDTPTDRDEPAREASTVESVLSHRFTRDIEVKELTRDADEDSAPPAGDG